jgi:hypothetical protein
MPEGTLNAHLTENETMTPAELIAELTKIRSDFQWFLASDSYHAPERRSRPRLHIRAIHKDVVGFLEPMGAVCYARTGRAYSVHAWPQAAEALKISESDAWTIMAACDDLTWRQAGVFRSPHHTIQSIRKGIISALGL